MLAHKLTVICINKRFNIKNSTFKNVLMVIWKKIRVVETNIKATLNRIIAKP